GGHVGDAPRAALARAEALRVAARVDAVRVPYERVVAGAGLDGKGGLGLLEERRLVQLAEQPERVLALLDGTGPEVPVGQVDVRGRRDGQALGRLGRHSVSSRLEN